jgi:hypothetical protein
VTAITAAAERMPVVIAALRSAASGRTKQDQWLAKRSGFEHVEHLLF